METIKMDFTKLNTGLKTIGFNNFFIDLIVSGKKTQTRRFANPQPKSSLHSFKAKFTLNDVIIIQLSSGGPALLDDVFIGIRINKQPSIQNIQDITDEDCYMEGCNRTVHTPRLSFRSVWDSIHSRTKKQWASNPIVYVYNFEFVKVKEVG